MNNKGMRLSELNIPRDESSRSFNCKVTTQQELINTEFWICDFIENVQTRHGDGRMLVLIKRNLEDPDSEAKKFFTNSSEIKYKLRAVKEHANFPVLATLKTQGGRYFIE